MEARTLFIKASRITESTLDPVHIARNKSANVETTISLDTNMLIGMEKVVKHGNKWASVKKQGLQNLVKLLHRCPPQSVCLSPGLALSEMPQSWHVKQVTPMSFSAPNTCLSSLIRRMQFTPCSKAKKKITVMTTCRLTPRLRLQYRMPV
ncbi:hypothetical protein Q8O96_23095 [Pseudomonas sp. LPH60]|uniref:hypothetical protein n=1 Tax=Pseudomonas sp. LPH60 TaxID=3065906 RepID=UPI00273C75F0|nr:hypothetical protein [Pseudomonas sp. LPH60]MDP4571960.1 hypothetical protein [Pseudomonas sp. LPH60]